MRTIDLPALHATHAGIWIAAGGAVREVGRGAAIGRLAETPCILLNAPLVGQRLGTPDVAGLDLLELFAFVHPARFAVPTVAGMARAVGIEPPASDAEAAPLLVAIADRLLATLSGDWPEREGAWTCNATLQRLGWGWAPFVAARLAAPERGERMLFSRLPQWEEAAERAAPRNLSIPAADAQERLIPFDVLPRILSAAEWDYRDWDTQGSVRAGLFEPRPGPGRTQPRQRAGPHF